MKARPGSTVALLVFLLAPVDHASPMRLAGGGQPGTDCLLQLDVDGAAATSDRTAACRDGDPACDGDGIADGRCRFRVRACLGQDGQERCTPSGTVEQVVRRGAAKAISIPPLRSAACGPVSSLEVPLRGGKRMGRQRFRLTAISRRPRRTDRDVFELRCFPPPPCSASTCAPNPDGGPDALVVTVLDQGTDLDLGWTGTYHGFPVPSGIYLQACLTDCDGVNDLECTLRVPARCDPSRTTFGPPLPIIGAGRLACVVNRVVRDVTGTVRLDTGAVEAKIDLASDVHVLDPERVCPQCRAGQCDSGRNRGRACTVDGAVTVTQSLSLDHLYLLSRDCPPEGAPAVTLPISLGLTTGTRTTPGTGGSKPCRDNEADGVPVKDDFCADGCGAACAMGSPPCVASIRDPADPGSFVCQDAKGGLSQTCCLDDPTRPCFPTRPGSPGILRTGRAVPPIPQVPGASYPLAAERSALVTTFCVGPTTLLDTVGGLPGPAAMVLAADLLFLKVP